MPRPSVRSKAVIRNDTATHRRRRISPSEKKVVQLAATDPVFAYESPRKEGYLHTISGCRQPEKHRKGLRKEQHAAEQRRRSGSHGKQMTANSRASGKRELTSVTSAPENIVSLHRSMTASTQNPLVIRSSYILRKKSSHSTSVKARKRKSMAGRQTTSAKRRR
ncbi:MAG: hypothetical protein ACLU9X_00450 [Alistipes shahii]